MSFLFPLGDLALPAAATAAVPELMSDSSHHGATAFLGQDLFPELLALLTDMDTASSAPTPEPAASATPLLQSMAGIPLQRTRFIHTNVISREKPEAAPGCEEPEVVASFPHAACAQPLAVQTKYTASAFPSHSLVEAGMELESDTESGDGSHTGNQAAIPLPSPTVDVPVKPKEPLLIEADFAWPPLSQTDGRALEENSNVHPVEAHALVEEIASGNAMPPMPSASGIRETATRESASESEPSERREPPLPVSSFVLFSPELPRQVVVPYQTFPPVEIESRRPSGTPIVRGDLGPLRREQEPQGGFTPVESAEPVAREAFRLLLRQTTFYRPGPDAVVLPPVETGSTHQPQPDGAVAEQTEGDAPVVAVPDPRPPEKSLTRRGLEPPLAGTASKPASEVAGRPRLTSQPMAPHFDGQTAPKGETVPPSRVEAKSSTYGEEEPRQGDSAKDDRVSAPAQNKESGPAWTSSLFSAETKPRSERTGSAAEATPVAPIEEPAPAVPVSRTVRQLRLSVETTTAGGSVELLLQQRPDGVEVSVHSQDNHLRDSLRTGLSDLVTNLEKQGIASDMLHPLRSSLPEHPSEPSVHKVRSEELASPVAEASESEAREDAHRQQREPLWEQGSDQRRRRDQRPDAWQKYLEEYTWRNR